MCGPPCLCLAGLPLVIVRFILASVGSSGKDDGPVPAPAPGPGPGPGSGPGRRIHVLPRAAGAHLSQVRPDLIPTNTPIRAPCIPDPSPKTVSLSLPCFALQAIFLLSSRVQNRAHLHGCGAPAALAALFVNAADRYTAQVPLRVYYLAPRFPRSLSSLLTYTPPPPVGSEV